MFYVIKRPIITEKTSFQAGDSFYAFEVEKTATKTEIKESIEKFFDVKVKSVNTLICRNKSTRTRLGKSKVRYWKKALVRLADGQSIAMFEGAN